MIDLSTNLLGFAASFAVLATFMMRTMLPLPVVAIASNVLFIAYGYVAHILPVLCLHIALLPINVARLSTLREKRFEQVRSLGLPAPWRMRKDA